MFRIKYIYLLLIAGLFCACEGDTFYLIPENEKLVFDIGDRLIYQSNYGRKDTFRVTEVMHDFESSTPKPNSTSMNFYEFIHYEIVREKNYALDTSFVNDIDFYYGGETYYKWDNTYQYINNLNKAMDSLVVFENTYYDIYEINLFQGEGKLNKIFCNNQFGVLRYEYPYNVYWELIKHIKRGIHHVEDDT